MSAPGPHSAFFYGTLMSPAVLHRVTGAPPTRPASSSPNATREPYYVTRPAILPAHRRRRVLNADYPAVTPAAASDSVRGTYVTGLSDNDVFRLDRFEGDEYRREKVRVRLLPLKEKTAVETSGPSDAAADGLGSQPREQQTATDEPLEEWADAQTYIWIAPEHELDEQEWDFDEFVRTKMWRWSGASEEFAAVDALEEHVGQDPTRGRQYFDGQREEDMVRAAV